MVAKVTVERRSFTFAAELGFSTPRTRSVSVKWFVTDHFWQFLRQWFYGLCCTLSFCVHPGEKSKALTLNRFGPCFSTRWQAALGLFVSLILLVCSHSSVNTCWLTFQLRDIFKVAYGRFFFVVLFFKSGSEKLVGKYPFSDFSRRSHSTWEAAEPSVPVPRRALGSPLWVALPLQWLSLLRSN